MILKTEKQSYKTNKIIKKDESDWVVHHDTHEAIISRDLWAKVREIEASVSQGKRDSRGDTLPLSGMLICGDCGYKMKMSYNNTTNGSKKLPRIYRRQNYNCGNYCRSGKWLPKSHTVDGVKVPTNDWNNRANCETWRENWSNAVNAVLEQNNIAERVDNRSFERQGIEQIPTVHLGVAAHQMEQRGIKTERGNINRKVEITNKELRQLKARITKLENWIKEETNNPKPPTLYDIISDILNRKSGIYSLKSAANMLMFLTDNNISDMSDLENKVDLMHKRQSTFLGRLKPVERQLKTLDEHIKQADNYKKYKAVSRHYNDLYSEYQSAQNATGLFAKSKAQKALDFANNYYESNRTELTLFNAAERYIKDVMQGRYDPKKLPPITKWKAEFKTLSADKDLIYREYYSLKDEVKEVEKVRRQVEGILREDKGRSVPLRKTREEYGLE